MATRPTSAREIAAALSDAPEDEALVLMERYAEDPRKQVQHAIAAARKRIERAAAERDRVHGMYSLMREMGGEGIVVGVDEVGCKKYPLHVYHCSTGRCKETAGSTPGCRYLYRCTG